MRAVTGLCILLFTCTLRLPAQESAVRADSTIQTTGATLMIVASVDSSVVFVDSVRAGRTPLTLTGVLPGKHRVRVMHPDIASWLGGVVEDSVVVGQGEQKTLRYVFPKKYLLVTLPSGAGVFMGDSMAGATPMLLSFGPDERPPSVSLKKIGFETTTVDLAGLKNAIETVTLKKTWEPGGQDEPSEEKASIQRPGSLRLYVTGITAVLAGAAAAYFKIQADNSNTAYQDTPTSSLLSETQRYDRASAVFLVVTQVSFGLFSYFLLTQ